MPRDTWQFSSSFPKVTLTAARIADDSALERLRAMAATLEGPQTQFACWSALSLALAERGRIQEATQFATPALALAPALELGRDWFCLRDHLPWLADALARTSNSAGLQRLREWILTLNPYYRGELFQALLPALGRLSDKAAIAEILASSHELRASDRSILFAAVSSMLLDAGDRDGAAQAARDALTAFEEERDGSVTPDVLPRLVPALVAIGDKDGLMGLLKMPGDKWPYPREWVPGLRLLLPALAKLGVDDPDPKGLEALIGHGSAFGEAQCDIAEAQARRGLFDQAAATAAHIHPAHCRAEAYFRLARVLAERGDSTAAEEQLLAAASNFPAIHQDTLLLGEMAVLAAEIGAAPRLRQGLKRAFLRAAEVNLVAIDADIFTSAVRPLARIGDEAALSQAAAVVDATRDLLAKARSGAALLLALAEAGRFAHIEERRKHTAQAIEQLVDITHKAVPLCHMAKALALYGRHEDAREAFLLALNAARHAGREAFFSLLQEGAGIACGLSTAAAQVADAIRAADSLWPPAA
jgi:tetratricopeptide (TPR) repeat protein